MGGKLKEAEFRVNLEEAVESESLNLFEFRTRRGSSSSLFTLIILVGYYLLVIDLDDKVWLVVVLVIATKILSCTRMKYCASAHGVLARIPTKIIIANGDRADECSERRFVSPHWRPFHLKKMSVVPVGVTISLLVMVL